MEDNFGSVLAKSLGQVLTTAAVEIPKQQEKNREAAITAFNTKLNFDAAMQQKELMAGKIREQNFNLKNLARLAVMTPEQRMEEMARQKAAEKQAELQATIDSALKNLGGLKQLQGENIEPSGINFLQPKEPKLSPYDEESQRLKAKGDFYRANPDVAGQLSGFDSGGGGGADPAKVATRGSDIVGKTLAQINQKIDETQRAIENEMYGSPNIGPLQEKLDSLAIIRDAFTTNMSDSVMAAGGRIFGEGQENPEDLEPALEPQAGPPAPRPMPASWKGSQKQWVDYLKKKGEL